MFNYLLAVGSRLFAYDFGLFMTYELQPVYGYNKPSSCLLYAVATAATTTTVKKGRRSRLKYSWLYRYALYENGP